MKMGCAGSTTADAGVAGLTSPASSSQKTLLRSLTLPLTDVKVRKQVEPELKPRDSGLTSSAPEEMALEVEVLPTRSLLQLLSAGDGSAESPDNDASKAALIRIAEAAEVAAKAEAAKTEAAEAAEAAQAVNKVADAADAAPTAEVFSAWLLRNEQEAAAADAETPPPPPPLDCLPKVPINVKVTGSMNGAMDDCHTSLLRCCGPPEIIPDSDYAPAVEHSNSVLSTLQGPLCPFRDPQTQDAIRPKAPSHDDCLSTDCPRHSCN